MTDYQVKTIFTQMKKGTNIIDLLGTVPLKNYYYFIKAFKLANESLLYSYVIDCKHTKTKELGKLLTKILSKHYPPLTYNHKLKDGMVGLTRYVTIAKQVFKS